MLNSHNGRAFSRSSALAFAVVLSVAGLGRPAAQAQSPWSGSFDERFTNHRRVASIFTRPKVISGLPSLPLTSPDESAPEPAPTASTNPPGAPEGEQPDRTGRKGVASAFISPLTKC